MVTVLTSTADRCSHVETNREFVYFLVTTGRLMRQSAQLLYDGLGTLSIEVLETVCVRQIKGNFTSISTGETEYSNVSYLSITQGLADTDTFKRTAFPSMSHIF